MVSVVEQKERVGADLYKRMKAEFDYSMIEWTIRRYDKSIDIDASKHMVDAFLQWAALAPLNKDRFEITMFVSPVEEAFHAFVLNTRLYHEFCDRFFGFFFHHDPLVDEAAGEVSDLAGRTVQLLQETYGSRLHPLLQQWVTMFQSGNYKVACVGPGGRCHL